MEDKKVRYASFADIISGKLGSHYLLKDSDIGGVGLFANKVFYKDDVICRYDGIKKHISDIRKDETYERSHLLLIKGTDYLVDGLPMRRDLLRDPITKYFWPQDVQLYFSGWACMANSSRGLTDIYPNARMDFFIDDETVRFQDYVPRSQQRISNGLTDVLGKKAYLIAKRTILIGEEILWDYNPQIQKIDIIDLT